MWKWEEDPATMQESNYIFIMCKTALSSNHRPNTCKAPVDLMIFFTHRSFEDYLVFLCASQLASFPSHPLSNFKSFQNMASKWMRSFIVNCVIRFPMGQASHSAFVACRGAIFRFHGAQRMVNGYRQQTTMKLIEQYEFFAKSCTLWLRHIWVVLKSSRIDIVEWQINKVCEWW